MDSRSKIQSYRGHEFVDLWDSRVVPGALNFGLGVLFNINHALY